MKKINNQPTNRNIGIKSTKKYTSKLLFLVAYYNLSIHNPFPKKRKDFIANPELGDEIVVVVVIPGSFCWILFLILFFFYPSRFSMCHPPIHPSNQSLIVDLMKQID